jgi:hypothetical protein
VAAGRFAVDFFVLPPRLAVDFFAPAPRFAVDFLAPPRLAEDVLAVDRFGLAFFACVFLGVRLAVDFFRAGAFVGFEVLGRPEDRFPRSPTLRARSFTASAESLALSTTTRSTESTTPLTIAWPASVARTFSPALTTAFLFGISSSFDRIHRRSLLMPRSTVDKRPGPRKRGRLFAFAGFG